MSCTICSAKLLPRTAQIKCDDCKKAFHGSCINLQQADIDIMISSGVKYNCSSCKSKQETEEKEPTLKDIFKEIQAFREEQSNIGAAVDAYHSELKQLSNLIDKQAGELKACTDKIELLESENHKLNSENVNIKTRLNDLEQYSRVNCLEITGVPEIKNENILTTIKMVATAVHFNLDPTMVDACHRLQKNPNNHNDPPKIIIKFVRRTIKDEFMHCKKVIRNLSTSHLDPTISGTLRTHNPIYINEALSSYNRQLLYRVRLFKKEKQFKHLWTKDGKIFLRKTDTSKIFRIKSESDLRDAH